MSQRMFRAEWSHDDPTIRVEGREYPEWVGEDVGHELGRRIVVRARKREDAVKMVEWELYKLGLPVAR